MYMPMAAFVDSSLLLGGVEVNRASCTLSNILNDWEKLTMLYCTEGIAL